MKHLFPLCLLIFIAAGAQAQQTNPNYDSRKLGADDYGMKSYYFVILKTGPNTTAPKAFMDSCFRGHLDNIGKLVREEKLIVAGPLEKNTKSYRGIFILSADSKEEAGRLLQSDPAIQSNLLATEIYTWYGSAALPEYLQSSEKIWKLRP